MTITTQPAPNHGSAGAASGPDSKDLTSVDKAIAVLRAFGTEANLGIGVSELARRAGLSKSTAFRILGMLERNGMVERVGTAYRFGTTIRELGQQCVETNHDEIRNLLTPFLAELFGATGMTVQLAVLEGTHIVYLNKLEGRQRLRTPSRIGGRMPAYCTAAGKALVAANRMAQEQVLSEPRHAWTDTTVVDDKALRTELAQVRQTGIAYDRGESLSTLSCAAVAVVAGRNRPVAALSISGPSDSFRPHQVEYTLRKVAMAASHTVAAHESRLAA